MLGFWGCQVHGQEPEKHKKIEPLSEQFLLFLAEMTVVDGDLIHPVDLEKKKQPEQTVKQVNEDGKENDDS